MKTPKESKGLYWLVLTVCAVNLVFTGLTYFKNSNPKKIAYIDALKLIGKYDGMADLKSEMEAAASQFKSNLDTLRTEYEAANANFLKNKGKLPVNSQLEVNVIRMRVQYTNYQQSFEENLKKREKEAMDVMLTKINKRIERYAMDNNYSVVLSGSQLGVIAYADIELDVTDEILDIINREYHAR